MMLGPFGSSVIQQCPLWLAAALFGLGSLACLRRRRRVTWRPAGPRNRKVTAARPLVGDGGTTFRSLPERAS